MRLNIEQMIQRFRFRFYSLIIVRDYLVEEMIIEMNIVVTNIQWKELVIWEEILA